MATSLGEEKLNLNCLKELTVCLLLHTNALGKGMNLALLPHPAMSK